MAGKLTRFVKVGFTDLEFHLLEQQAEADNRDLANFLKVLWIQHMNIRIAAQKAFREQKLGAFSGRTGTYGDSEFQDTEST